MFEKYLDYKKLFFLCYSVGYFTLKKTIQLGLYPLYKILVSTYPMYISCSQDVLNLTICTYIVPLLLNHSYKCTTYIMYKYNTCINTRVADPE